MEVVVGRCDIGVGGSKTGIANLNLAQKNNDK